MASIIRSFVLSLVDIFASLFRFLGVLLRIAFPPDPNHAFERARAERNLTIERQRHDAPFLAFISRAKSHDHYLGGRFKLLRSPLLAV